MTTNPRYDAAAGRPGSRPTVIDCDTCIVRGLACQDCVVTVLLGPPDELSFGDDERAALDALAAGGLVPPLRLVTPLGGHDADLP